MSEKISVIRKKLTAAIIFILAACGSHLHAQDIQFSQFYNVPLYLNPSFAGSAHHSRAIMHQRLQWPGVDARYNTSVFSFDKFFHEYRSGVGLMVLKDFQGANTISSTDISLMYSYELHINDNMAFRPGFQLGYVSRYLNYADLRFPSQHNDRSGYDPGAPTVSDEGNRRIHYADVGTGGTLYSRNLWVGFSAHHVNRPNQAFETKVDESRLPVKYAFVGGYKILLGDQRKKAYSDDEKEISIIPTAHYKFQGKSDQFDVGLYGIYDQILTGVWYRGIPIKKYLPNLQNNESMVVFLGWRFEGWKFGYSYDFVLSKLAIARTGGAHEFNLTYVFLHRYKKKKPMRRMPCPTL